MTMNSFTKRLFTAVVALSLFVSSNAFGQDYYSYGNASAKEKNIRLGLSINPNIGWLRYDDDDYNSGGRAGFSYGLLADLGFSENYYFSTGLLINSIAGKMSYTGSKEGDEFFNRDLIRLQYVEVPLTIKLKSVENDLGRFYGQFGFTAGVKVSGKEKVLRPDVSNPKNTSIAKDDLFRLGLQLGGGAEWKINDNLAFLTGLTFNNGFTRAINNDGKPRTSFVALNLGILF